MDGWMDVLSGQCSNNGWRCNRKRTVYCKVLFTSLHQPQGTWLPLGSTSKCGYLKERTTPPPYVWSANSPRALQILAGGTKKLTFSSKVVLIYIFIHSIVVRSPSSTTMVIKAFIGIVWCGRSIGRSFPYLLSAVLPRFARQRQIVKCHSCVIIIISSASWLCASKHCPTGQQRKLLDLSVCPASSLLLFLVLTVFLWTCV